MKSEKALKTTPFHWVIDPKALAQNCIMRYLWKDNIQIFHLTPSGRIYSQYYCHKGRFYKLRPIENWENRELFAHILSCPCHYLFPACEDIDAECPGWADGSITGNLECEGEHAHYMLVSCKKSCGACGGNTTVCEDLVAECPGWADGTLTGNLECEANPDYMLVYCKQSCGVCWWGSHNGAKN